MSIAVFWDVCRGDFGHVHVLGSNRDGWFQLHGFGDVGIQVLRDRIIIHA